MSKWISVNERLPEKEGLGVLVSRAGSNFVRLAWIRSTSYNKRPVSRWLSWQGVIPEESITHWMPLPNPPL